MRAGKINATRCAWASLPAKEVLPMSKLLDWVLAVLKLVTVLAELALLLTSL